MDEWHSFADVMRSARPVWDTVAAMLGRIEGVWVCAVVLGLIWIRLGYMANLATASEIAECLQPVRVAQHMAIEELQELRHEVGKLSTAIDLLSDSQRFDVVEKRVEDAAGQIADAIARAAERIEKATKAAADQTSLDLNLLTFNLVPNDRLEPPR